MQELSQWFNLSEQKPWADGVYEVHRANHDYRGQYSLFKSGCFHEVGVTDVDSAIYWAEKCCIGDGVDVVRWRGLSSDPSQKPAPPPKPR